MPTLCLFTAYDWNNAKKCFSQSHTQKILKFLILNRLSWLIEKSWVKNWAWKAKWREKQFQGKMANVNMFKIVTNFVSEPQKNGMGVKTSKNGSWQTHSYVLNLSYLSVSCIYILFSSKGIKGSAGETWVLQAAFRRAEEALGDGLVGGALCGWLTVWAV